MHFWYADDSNLKSDKKVHVPNIFLFGGILIEQEESKKLIDLLKEIKGRYTFPDLPIKYNLKDLKDKYKEFGREDEFKRLLHESMEWREELFRKSLDIDYQIVIAAVENFQTDRRKQKEIKEDIRRYVFTNAMMRISYEIKLRGYGYTQFILDWPADGNSKPFNSEFYYAYNRGKSRDGGDYYSGPLKHIGIHDSLLFTNMNHSNCLQFADLIIGAARDFLDCILDGRDHSNGKYLTEIILPKYRGYPNKILEYGLNVSSRNERFKNSLKEKFK